MRSKPILGRERAGQAARAAAARQRPLASSAGVQLVWIPTAQIPGLPPSPETVLPAVIDWIGCPPTLAVTVTPPPPTTGTALTSMGGAALAEVVPAARANKATIPARVTLFMLATFLPHDLSLPLDSVFVTVAGVILTVNGRERAGTAERAPAAPSAALYLLEPDSAVDIWLSRN
jgi:hypothetical protein